MTCSQLIFPYIFHGISGLSDAINHSILICLECFTASSGAPCRLAVLLYNVSFQSLILCLSRHYSSVRMCHVLNSPFLHTFASYYPSLFPSAVWLCSLSVTCFMFTPKCVSHPLLSENSQPTNLFLFVSSMPGYLQTDSLQVLLDRKICPCFLLLVSLREFF